MLMLVRAHNPTDAEVLQAAADGDLEFFKQLNQQQQQQQPVCTSGCTALHWAAGMNQVHIIRHLLKMSTFHADFPIAKKYKAAGRTPLHYAARNGCLEAAQCLIEEFHATPDATAKHGVTPMHLAFFQNQKTVAEYLLHLQQDNIALFQTNNYGCNVLHWVAICPVSRAGPEGGAHLVPTAQWLYEMQQQKFQLIVDSNHVHDQCGISNKYDLFHAKQTQGHTVLHKAAWLGHYALIRYLHEFHDVWDDSPDHSGNYAVTLAEMARHNDGDATVNYLRMFCSRSASHSCSMLGLTIEDVNSPARIRQAYYRMAMKYHPDRQRRKESRHSHENVYNIAQKGDHPDQNDSVIHTFDDVYKAYHHLLHEKGRGLECNEAHKLKILLPSSEETTFANDDDCFKTRLLVVLREYGSKGLDVSNLKKKWKQVWQTSFPRSGDSKPLTEWLQDCAGDVVEIRIVNQCHRAYAKTQQ